MDLKTTRWLVVGLALLVIGFATSLAAEELTPSSGCGLEALPLFADEGAPSCTNADQTPGTEELGKLESVPEPIFMSCSGDLCGCFTPPCNEQCEVGDTACMSSCRQEQKRCAICCCCGPCPYYC